VPGEEIGRMLAQVIALAMLLAGSVGVVSLALRCAKKVAGRR